MTRCPCPPVISRAHRHAGRTAIIDAHRSFTYTDLLNASSRGASTLLANAGTADSDDLHEQRVAFAITPGFLWVAAQWAIWCAGGIAVPLPLNCPAPELEYFIEDSGASTLVYDADSAPLLLPIAQARGLRALSADQLQGAPSLELPDATDHAMNRRRAMILYTSGTQNRPKGVVTTHTNITAQITSLVEAWEESPGDRSLLCLPLHHVHGIINVVSCALWTGASCYILPRFNAETVWNQVADGHLTLFMAVPTIYVKLIAAWESYSPERQQLLTHACANLRLMVSGSAALPVSTLRRWKEISGHTLLERYGMTEIGMALSNPLRGERIPGSVGTPLPGVEVRLVSEDGSPIPAGTPGEIEVRGANVFSEYWGKPETTRAAFRDGWFRTGDMALVESGVYRILGRISIDILKTGGHKVSALEIEEVLREHPAVAECAIVGVPDPEWGERVAAAVVLNHGHSLDLASLRTWARNSLATHKLPTRLLVVDDLPRNKMGKVTKRSLVALF